VSNIYCVVLCLSSYCVPYIASFSRLSIFDCPSVFSNVYLLILPVIQKLFVNITYFYITYVYCRIIYNLFVRVLETGRKVSANFIFTDNVRILYLSCVKTKRTANVFNVVLCNVRAYTVTVSYRRST
jgi:hypothetical protein